MTRTRLPRPPVLLITDRKMAVRPLTDVAAAALAGGCRWILVREKDLEPDDLLPLVADIVRLAEPHGALVSVSGNAVVAAKAGAKGVHLPQDGAHADAVAEARQRLGGDALIGVSTHSIAEAQAAARDGADYATYSPIFLTASKPGYGPALGLDQLADATANVLLPLVALAGIDATNAAGCREAGAAGIAVMGSIMRATDPGTAIKAMIEAWGA